MQRFRILSFVFFFIHFFFIVIIFFILLKFRLLSFHVLKVAPVFISIQSINLHAMRFLIAMNKRSSSLSLSFFNFIRMQFDLPTKTDCFLTVKSIKTPLDHKSFGRRQLKFTYVVPLTGEFPNCLNNFIVLAKMHMHICRDFLRSLEQTNSCIPAGIQSRRRSFFFFDSLCNIASQKKTLHNSMDENL